MTLLLRLFPLALLLVLLGLARVAAAQEIAPPAHLCVLGAHDGLDDDDARTAEDIVCSALSTHRAPPATYETRFGKLGSQLLVVVTSRATGEERRLLLQGVEEVPVGAERIARAFAEHEAVAATVGPERVTGAESLPPRARTTVPGVYLGTTGMTAAGAGGGALSSGFDIAILMQLRQVSLVFEGRAGGIGSADDKLGYASLGAGARYTFGSGDIAPFVGGGLGFAYFQANRGDDEALSGSGLDAYTEVGISFFRSSHAGLMVSLRADLPTFSLAAGDEDGKTSPYELPLSLNVGLRFQ